MATSGNTSDTCSICTDTFKQPKLLPCFHTFCFDCLEQHASSSSKGGQFHCPVCRHLVTLPKEGVVAFQTNFYIEAREERERHDAGECCGVCEQSASHTCSECEMMLCDACTKYHRIFPVTRSHMLINLGESDSEKPFLSKQRFCEKHSDEKLRFYCKHCSKVICRDCKLTSHDGHKTVDISDVVAEARNNLEKTKVKLETYKTNTKESYLDVIRMKTELSENMKTSNAEINKFADMFLNSLGEIINKSRNKQINRVTDAEQTQRKKYCDEENVLSQRECFLESQIDHCDVMLREGLDCDLITTDEEMKQRLAEIEKEQNTYSDSQPEYFPPNPAANPGQLELVRCAVNDVMINSFTASEKNVLIQETKRMNYEFYIDMQSISFTKSQKVYLTVKSRLSSNVLNLYETSSLVPTWRLKVTLDEMRNNGVHGVIVKYNKENPHKKISEDDYTDLKKPFPYMDINDDGDNCRVTVVDDYSVVIIKPVNGVVRMLTFNPFAKPGEEFKPVDVCWGSNQEVYIADRGADMIVLYSLRDGFQKSFQSPCKYRLSAIAMDREGKLWVGDVLGFISICNVD